MSALLNWFKLVNGIFEQSNMQSILDFCQSQRIEYTKAEE